MGHVGRIRPKTPKSRGGIAIGSGKGLPILSLHRGSRTSEDGFTLIELLIVLVIMPLIVGAVAVVMITSLKATTDKNGTTARLAESHDAQITSTYFARDVQNSTRITTASTLLCGSGQLTGTQTLGLIGNGGATAISYATVTKVNTRPLPSPVLMRVFCAAGPSNTYTNTSTVSHLFQSIAPAALTCNRTYGNMCAADAQSGQITSLDVATVEIVVTEVSGFTFNLDGSPRQWLGSTQGLVASNPPLVLGSGGAQCSRRNVDLSVTGVLAVNSAKAGSIRIGGALTALQVYSPPIIGGGSPVSPSGSYTQLPPPPVTPMYATGPGLPDPYASLPAPSPGGASTYVYTSPLTTGNDGPTKLKSGIYILQKGMNASLTSDPGGVFFYVTGGAVSLGGDPNLNLSAMTGTTGPDAPYFGVLLYQVPSDTNTLTLLGTPTANSLDGVVDASGASVNLQGRGTVSALGLVAAGLACQRGTSGAFGPQTTATTVTSSSTPLVQGQRVTFTAKVSASGASVSGSVKFTVVATGGGTVTCDPPGNTVPLDASGRATCATSALTNARSPYTVTADYFGTLGFQASSGSLSQLVKVQSSTSVTSSQNPSVSGQSVQFRATVTGTANPTGNATFTVTDKTNNTYSCVGGNNAPALTGGSATCTLAAGQLLSTNSPITVSVAYGGDPNNTPSAGSLSQVVNVGKVHLTALSGVGTIPNGNNWRATVTVQVQDGKGNTVTGVVVTGSWSAAGPVPPGCTTTGSGQCSFTTGHINVNTNPSETWAVTNLAVAGYAYDPASNVLNSVTVTHS